MPSHLKRNQTEAAIASSPSVATSTPRFSRTTTPSSTDRIRPLKAAHNSRDSAPTPPPSSPPATTPAAKSR